MSAPLYVNTIGVVAAACSMGSARYGSFEFSASSPDVSLMALQFREGQRFVYEYDLNIPWRHEVRIEAWPEPAAGKTYPTCIGGHGTCPPEDCGGPAAFMARRDDVVSMDMLEDRAEMAEILEPFILERRPEVLATRRSGVSKTLLSARMRVRPPKGDRSRSTG